MEKRRRPFWFRLIRGLLIIYAGLCVFSCTMSDSLIFVPQRPAYAATAPGLVSLKTTEGETIPAYHFPAKDGKPTVLYSHGNAEDIGGSIDLYQEWRRDGWGVLAYDYPGYGHATGKPTERSCERAVEAAWQFLMVEQKVAPGDILVVGRSVGSGPSVWLAGRHQPGGLVLISPFTSAFALLAPAHLVLPGNRFPNLKRVRDLETPLLVIHGDRDQIVPASHGRRIFDASPAPLKRFVRVPDAGHNDLSWMDIIIPIREFATEIRKSQD